MAREGNKREPRDNVLNLALGLCGFGVMFLIIAADTLNARAYVLLECTRGRDCFLTRASWLTREQVHFREPALRGAHVSQDRDGRRGTLLDRYRPFIDVDTSGLLQREITLDQAGDKLLENMLRTANGRLTAAEALGHREFVLTRLFESA